jgi:hypothetical protein
MDDRKNTIAMMVLAAGIVALGGSIATGEFFHAERPEKMGYVVEGVEVEGEGGGEAAKPIEFYLASADRRAAPMASARTCGAPSASRTAMSQASPIRTR